MSKTIKINTVSCPDGTILVNGEFYLSIGSGDTQELTFVDLEGQPLNIIDTQGIIVTIDTGNGLYTEEGNIILLENGDYLTAE